MLIVVLADAEQKKELLAKGKNGQVTIQYADEFSDLLNFPDAGAIFILREELNIERLTQFTQPLFINSVISTLTDLHLPSHISRLNAWPTFLQRDVWEVATGDEGVVKNIFEEIGWRYLVMPDEPGFVAARIIAMIVNEAYFTWEEKISSKNEIDTAMRLGTNYPYGPFEWAEKIGLKNIYQLLNSLGANSRRYQMSAALQQEFADT